MKRLAILFVLMAAAACENPLDIDGARRATASEVQRALELYKQTSECLSLPGSPDTARWWIVSVLNYEGAEKGGAHIDNDIYILRDRMNGDRIWKHESMHHILLHSTGDNDRRHRSALWSECTAPVTTPEWKDGAKP